MQLVDLKSDPHGGKILRNIIDRAVGAHFYPPPRSEHSKLLCLDHFYGPFQINCEQEKKSEIRMRKIPNTRNCTTKPRANQI